MQFPEIKLEHEELSIPPFLDSFEVELGKMDLTPEDLEVVENSRGSISRAVYSILGSSQEKKIHSLIKQNKRRKKIDQQYQKFGLQNHLPPDISAQIKDICGFNLDFFNDIKDDLLKFSNQWGKEGINLLKYLKPIYRNNSSQAKEIIDDYLTNFSDCRHQICKYIPLIPFFIEEGSVHCANKVIKDSTREGINDSVLEMLLASTQRLHKKGLASSPPETLTLFERLRSFYTSSSEAALQILVLLSDNYQNNNDEFYNAMLVAASLEENPDNCVKLLEPENQRLIPTLWEAYKSQAAPASVLKKAIEFGGDCLIEFLETFKSKGEDILKILDIIASDHRSDREDYMRSLYRINKKFGDQWDRKIVANLGSHYQLELNEKVTDKIQYKILRPCRDIEDRKLSRKKIAEAIEKITTSFGKNAQFVYPLLQDHLSDIADGYKGRYESLQLLAGIKSIYKDDIGKFSQLRNELRSISINPDQLGSVIKNQSLFNNCIEESYDVNSLSRAINIANIDSKGDTLNCFADGSIQSLSELGPRTLIEYSVGQIFSPDDPRHDEAVNALQKIPFYRRAGDFDRICESLSQINQIKPPHPISSDPKKLETFFKIVVEDKAKAKVLLKAKPLYEVEDELFETFAGIPDSDISSNLCSALLECGLDSPLKEGLIELSTEVNENLIPHLGADLHILNNDPKILARFIEVAKTEHPFDGFYALAQSHGVYKDHPEWFDDFVELAKKSDSYVYTLSSAHAIYTQRPDLFADFAALSHHSNTTPVTKLINNQSFYLEHPKAVFDCLRDLVVEEESWFNILSQYNLLSVFSKEKVGSYFIELVKKEPYAAVVLAICSEHGYITIDMLKDAEPDVIQLLKKRKPQPKENEDPTEYLDRLFQHNKQTVKHLIIAAHKLKNKEWLLTLLDPALRLKGGLFAKLISMEGGYGQNLDMFQLFLELAYQRDEGRMNRLLYFCENGCDNFEKVRIAFDYICDTTIDDRTVFNTYFRHHQSSGQEGALEYLDSVQKEAKNLIGNTPPTELRQSPEYMYMVKYIYPPGDFSSYDQNLSYGDECEHLDKFILPTDHQASLTGLLGYNLNLNEEEKKDHVKKYKEYEQRLLQIRNFLTSHGTNNEAIQNKLLNKVNTLLANRIIGSLPKSNDENSETADPTTSELPPFSPVSDKSNIFLNLVNKQFKLVKANSNQDDSAAENKKRDKYKIANEAAKLTIQEKIMILFLDEILKGNPQPTPEILDLLIEYKYTFNENLEDYIIESAAEVAHFQDENSKRCVLWNQLSTIYGENMKHTLRHDIVGQVEGISEDYERILDAYYDANGTERKSQNLKTKQLKRIKNTFTNENIPLENPKNPETSRPNVLRKQLYIIFSSNINFVDEKDKEDFNTKFDEIIGHYIETPTDICAENFEKFNTEILPKLKRLRVKYLSGINQTLNDLFSYDLKEINTELSHYTENIEVEKKGTRLGDDSKKRTVKKTAKRYDIEGVFTKTAEATNGKTSSWICLAENPELWERSTYFEEHFHDSETGIFVGLNMMEEVQAKDGKHYLYFGPNPTENFLSKVSSETCYKFFYDCVCDFAEKNGYAGVFIPANEGRVLGVCTQRSGNFPDLIRASRLRDKEGKYKLIEFDQDYEIGRRHNGVQMVYYTIEKGALVWENPNQ